MILLTGVAGFIGMHVAQRLLDAGQPVLGVDKRGPQAPGLHGARLAALAGRDGFAFVQCDLAEPAVFDDLLRAAAPSCVVHLAAQTGVRQAAQFPADCVRDNLVAFSHVLEACRRHGVGNLLYASSSSIYGANRRLPFSEQHRADHPVSLYAATKRSNELLAHSYSNLYRLPTTGLRFFTVYGPWGRPDMAPMLFADALTARRPIDVYNGGHMLRDFTFVDDVAETVARLIDMPARPDPDFDRLQPNPSTSDAPFRLFNVGNQQPVRLDAFIDALEDAFGVRAQRCARPMPGADMLATCADTRALTQAIGWSPATPLRDGVNRFARWYGAFHA